MSDLSRSLVDAAAEAAMACAQEMDVVIEENPGATFDYDSYDRSKVRAAVVAVLETLAAHYEGPGLLMGAGSLRQLAAEVRGKGAA